MAGPTEPTTVDDFLQALQRSGLLDAEAVRATLDTAPDGARDDPQRLADHFVRVGRLSHFQARKLLEGAAGGLVVGPYQIVMPIGRGGMGTVYLARDSRAPRLLALKVLPPRKARASERLLARFRREMELSTRVAHSNLTRTYDVGVAHGVYYIAMEYIAGQSLYRLVTTHGPLTVGRAAKLFVQAAAGLEHAHELGMVHRDLKPSNILVTPRDQVKVLDLGLAVIQGEMDDPTVVGGKGYIVGTMDYIAPEQTEDSANVDARSDLYGLGCTIYFALTGQPPFPGGDARQKIQRHRKAVPPALQELNPLVPADFAAIIHPLLAKRPEDRPPSAAALREQLLPWADPLPEPMDSPAAADAPGAIAELEADKEPRSEWEWVPTVSLAEVTGRAPRPAPRRPASRASAWWSEMGLATRLLAALTAALALLALAVLFVSALRG